MAGTKTAVLFGVGALLFLLIGRYAPPSFLGHFTVFVLACFVGYMVVWNVTPALHTPLMSVTNAVSSIIAIGALVQIAPDLTKISADSRARTSGYAGCPSAAIALATINMFGGFAVTRRMLRCSASKEDENMTSSLSTVAYLGATILFILCLGGLSNQETSRRGNLYGMIGMAVAVLATVFGAQVTAAGLPYIVAAMVVGAAIGLYAARIVQMTQMPELVALMHSLVGLAAMLVGYANFIDPAVASSLTPAENTIHEIEMYLGVLIGAVTFSGSVIAFGKLSARISGKPMLLPGRHWLNLAGLVVVIWFGYRVRRRARRGRGDAADDRDDDRRAALRRAHGDGDRRRRHAGRRVDAEQLLGVGGGGDRLHARTTS